MAKDQIDIQIDSYLSFRLDDESFAVNVGKVLSILELSHITKIPKAPDYFKGVINLRGEVLPVVDTKVKFGMNETEFTNNTCILVLDITLDKKNIKVGVLVDGVNEVFEKKEDDILAPPSIGNKFKSDFITGVIEQGESFIMVLDIEMIFSSDELLLLAETASTQADTDDSES